MAKLPDRDKHWIPDNNIRDFALGERTPKAMERHAFFTSYGFTKANWMEMKAAAMAHAQPMMPKLSGKMSTARHMLLPRQLPRPTGATLSLQPYWIIRVDDPRPQLTTIFRRT